MTSRDLVIRALNHEPVERIPRDLWYAPGVAARRADEVAEIELRFPRDIVPPEIDYPPGRPGKAAHKRKGPYTDAWGCTWSVTAAGALEAVDQPPLDGEASLRQYQPPMELIEKIRRARVNQSCNTTPRFVLAWSQTQPFQRLQWLRGRQAVLAGLDSGNGALADLLQRLHEFSCSEMKTWAATEVDGVAFTDSWGDADGLVVNLELWRERFKPLYRDYCQILHDQDKFAFFRSGGNIAAILPELIEIGVDAVYADLDRMDLDRLAEAYRGQVTFWAGLGPQITRPAVRREEIAEAVGRIRRALDFGRGGIIAQCEWPPDLSFRTIAALLEPWTTPMAMHA